MIKPTAEDDGCVVTLDVVVVVDEEIDVVGEVAVDVMGEELP